MKVEPNVAALLPQIIPKGYRLGVDGWSFPARKLRERLRDGTRKLLTLDISISPDKFIEKVNHGNLAGLTKRVDLYYGMVCPNNCPACFEKGEVKNFLLSLSDVKNCIEQASKLGLESVKFLGPGELEANPEMFNILDYFEEKKIKICIFTKGEILGDDGLARKYQRTSSRELIKRICDYRVTRILIDCRTFDLEKAAVLSHSMLKNFAQARNRAIELLVENGMNSDLDCQRMSLQANPVTEDNIDDVLEIFKWGTERNIPVCVTPTMVSGRGRLLIQRARNPKFQFRLIELYADIYTFLIERGIVTFGQLKKEGVSSYAGIAPCNQLSCGMFIRKDGVVLRCPGNDHRQNIIFEDVRKQYLRDIWRQSVNYAQKPVFNNKCVKDGYSIPIGLYEEVLKKVQSRVARALSLSFTVQRKEG